ncbi:hypothetical protein LguiA_031884 [Lonicera macranthoides]
MESVSMEVEQLPHLPHEIVVVILSRLPVKSLLQFKRVCKRWYSSISDPQFVKMHLNQVSKQTDRIMLSSKTYDLANPVCYVDSESPYGHHPAIGRIDFPLMEPGPIGEVYGSCNGLVLIVYNDSKILLWNPFMRQYREVPYPHGRIIDNRTRLYGLGYDSATDDYKLALLIFDGYFPCSFLIYVLSLEANRWKKNSQTCTYSVAHQQTTGAAAMVNGAFHWVMNDLGYERFSVYLTVGYFDLTDEKVKGIRLPASLERPSEVRPFLGVLDGCLCSCSRSC